MTLALLLKSVATSPFVSDVGVGTEIATIGLGVPRSTTEAGFGSDVASVVIQGVAAEFLPKITLQISYDAPAGPIYREAVTTAPATAYYRLQEASGAVIDVAGNMNLAVFGGVTRGQTTLVSGEPSDKSYDFNGSTGYLRGDDNALLDTDDFTLEALIRPDSVSGTRSIMRRITSFEAQNDIWGLQIIDGKLRLFICDVTDTIYYYWSTFTFQTATEYHIMVISRQTQVEFYVDGALKDFMPKSWTTLKRGITPPDSSAPEGTPPTEIPTELIIGAGPLIGGVFSEFFDGKIDEPAVYTFDLPAEAPAYHHRARTAPSTYSWTTISDDSNSQLKELSIKSGRQDIFREIETGVFGATLENQDRAFDPTYTGSPYYPNLRPAMPIRCIASKNGVSYNLFRGDVEDWPQDWQGRLNNVPITALDALDVLTSAHVVVDRGVELTGARVHAILDAAAWPRELRDINVGSSLVQAWDNLPGQAMELLQKVVLSESGHLYVDGRGFVVFRDRETRFNSTVAVTFSNIPTGGELPITDASVVEDKDQIFNDIRITITDRDTHVAQSPESIIKHRYRSLSLELPLEDDTEGIIKAHWLLQIYKDPFKRIKEVVLEPQQNTLMWQHALGRSIGDRIRFKVYPPGPGTYSQFEAHIEYISHKLSNDRRWVTQWVLSPADINQYWILGTSTLGVDTKLAY